MDVYEIILNFYVIYGMVSVLLCFGFMMPFIGTALSVLTGIVMGEQVVAKMRGFESGTVMED